MGIEDSLLAEMHRGGDPFGTTGEEKSEWFLGQGLLDPSATLRISPGGSDADKTAQDVLFRAWVLAENPIECRIFFADNAR